MKSCRDKIFGFVKSKYGVLPEYLWEKFPSYAVLRNKESKKWFGVLMLLPKEKLGLSGKGEVEVLNLKCDPFGILQLLEEGKNFLPAYHMNKKYWISVLLDNSAEMDRVENLLQMSYDLVSKRKNK